MKVYKVPLQLEPQPEGGYTVTSPALHGLVTEGETVAEALAHAAEALELVLDDYDAEGTPLPKGLRQEAEVIEIDYPVVRP
ncbi:MAG: type II toxin-antitoxin system HicB family antitoxin [Candidatus Tectomicrobia bacterium]|nr:type II toxin-antitoxin system HicB family antitoxin [Candidatus Tectomicrobia bacterium]